VKSEQYKADANKHASHEEQADNPSHDRGNVLSKVIHDLLAGSWLQNIVCSIAIGLILLLVAYLVNRSLKGLMIGAGIGITTIFWVIWLTLIEHVNPARQPSPPNELDNRTTQSVAPKQPRFSERPSRFTEGTAPSSTPEQSPSPTMSRPAAALTPLQIVKEVRDARPFQREGIAQTFVGIPVDWLLIFLSANRLPEKEERWQLLFRPKDDNLDWIIVEFEIPIKENEYLRGIDKGEVFRVKGVIKEVYDPLSSILLDNVSFERLSDHE
jgi:hypothetical protein